MADSSTRDNQGMPNVRAQLRVIVTRILREHGYSPGKQANATHTVLESRRRCCQSNERRVAVPVGVLVVRPGTH